MPENKPVVYLLHGDDPTEMAKTVGGMTAKLAESGMREMNLSEFDGRSVSESDLRTAVMALPFFDERRLVILDYAVARMGKPNDERFKFFLDQIPPTTALVLLAHDQFEVTGRHKGWEGLPAKHWVWGWIEKAGSHCWYKACRPPDQKKMPGWIRMKAEALGGKFSPSASETLADQTGNDTLYAVQEITKLLTYVDGSRAVEADDVQLLTAPGGQVSVFDMVDALADGNSGRALHLLRDLLDETDTASLFGLMVRQFRLLIQARELIEEGGSADIARELGLPGFVASKLLGQAGRLNMLRLRQVYHRLLVLDEGTKSSQWTPELALEMFVAEMKS